MFMCVDSLVSAIGTAFVVRLDNEKISVLVTEGIVEVRGQENESKVSSTLEPRIASEGHQVVLHRENSLVNSVVETVSPEIINKSLAWRDGLMVFDGDPLHKVVTEVARYTDVEIILSGSELNDLPVGGVFKVGEVDALIGALKLTLNMDVERPFS